MKILFVSTEVFPYIKTGGLGDVSGALPKALEKRGHDLRIILPKYNEINSQEFEIESTPIKYNIPNFEYKAEIEKTIVESSNIIAYFVKCDYFFNRTEIYGDYEDNAERFIFFSKSVLELLKYIDWKPEIIHCNDWQTALIPALLKNLYITNPIYQKIRVLFTIHNMAYQGIFPKEKFTKTGLDWSLFKQHKIELSGKLNLLKAGLVFADILNTVSERYALEIQNYEFGYNLYRLLRRRKSDLFGILNGIDYEIWNPRTDLNIWYNYDINSLEKKEWNKAKLQKEISLPQKNVPMIGIVSRLVDQKGFDLIAEIIDEIMDLNLQFILVGKGQSKFHDLFTEMAQNYPLKSAIFLEFDDILSHKIKAGSDFFLMPSLYEPCGLNQLISLRYGTIPIVRYTGGLADSILDINVNPDNGVGFIFYKYDSQELLQIIKSALNFYKDKNRRLIVIKRGMCKDFSWTIPAQKYEQLYQKAFQKN